MSDMPFAALAQFLLSLTVGMLIALAVPLLAGVCFKASVLVFNRVKSSSDKKD